MSAYFKPLRRKIGVLTLAMALWFLAIWAKSLFGQDTLSISTGDQSHHFIFTSPYGLVWKQVWLPENQETGPWYGTLDHRIYRTGWFSNHEIDFDPKMPFKAIPVDWHWRLLGFHCGSAHDATSPFLNVRLVAIPYWMPVLLLALPSVWLLLGRPRQKSDAKS